MAVQKKKKSTSKGGMRRAHQALPIQGVSICPNCQEAKQPHRVCPHCGHYAGREVFQTEE